MFTRAKGVGAAVVALVLALAVVVAPRAALADDYENVLYATLSEDGTTMTYSYGNASMDKSHFVYTSYEGNGNHFSLQGGEYHDYDYDGVVTKIDGVTKIVFDESVSDWSPVDGQLHGMFFCRYDDSNNARFGWLGDSVTSIDGIEHFNTSGVTDVRQWFSSFVNMENIDLSSLDFSSVVNARELFAGCSKLKTFALPSDMSKCNILSGMFSSTAVEDVDLSGITFAPMPDGSGYEDYSISRMFESCYKLRSVNLSSISFDGVHQQYDYMWLFSNPSVLKSMTVGRGWRFRDYHSEASGGDDFAVNIPQPPVNDTFTGKWWKGPDTQAYTLAEMDALTDPDEIAGTWTWERRRYEVSFDLGYKTDEQAPETVYVDLDGSLNELPTVSRDGYTFDGWFDDKGVVSTPYEMTDDVNLVAHWSEIKPDPKPDPEPSPAPAPKPAGVDKVYMHRLYNPNSGEHFYTASSHERDVLVSVGWNYEGWAWGCPRTSRTPVYRLYNPVSGDNHHYTVSNNERMMLVKAGWTDEGIAWYGVDNTCKDGTEVNVFRAYNPYTITHKGTHNWTTSAYEQKTICDLGWRDEGVSFVAYPPKS